MKDRQPLIGGIYRHVLAPVIIHAQIRWPGGGGVMLGDAEGGDAFHLSLPFGPVSIYVVTDQPDALHDRAVAVGATIVRGLRDEDYGSRGFSATDPVRCSWSSTRQGRSCQEVWPSSRSRADER
jgi:uncharacterized glyoxalase superfamily protein PhnB